MIRKGLISAAVAVLTLGSAAFAGDMASSDTQVNAGVSNDVFQLAQNPVLLDDTTPAAAPAATPDATAAPAAAAPATPDAPLMQGLDAIGVGKTLKDLHLTIGGYVEMGYEWDFTVPKNQAPSRSSPPNFIFFPGDYKNQLMLNQVDLDIQRTVDATQNKFDIGFNIEGFYGRDAVYTHSNGILDNHNKHGGTSRDDDLDLEQAYLTFAIPVGSGLTLTAGKFATLLGNETINPTTNALYTHSYIFSYGIPFTQTGVLAKYNLTDALSITAGFTRGWNQSTDDNNGAIDFLGELAWTVNSKLSATLNVSEGPQSTDDNSDYWTVIEALGTFKVSDQLSLTADLLYGDANAIAQWYAAAGYATYTFNKYVTGNLRAEFYHDGRGFTTGVGVTDTNYIEATVGVGITPLPDNNLASSLTVRPELRLDTADRGVYDGTKFTQLTASVDAYWKF